MAWRQWNNFEHLCCRDTFPVQARRAIIKPEIAAFGCQHNEIGIFTGVLITGGNPYSHGLRRLFFLSIFFIVQEEGVSVARGCHDNTLLLHHALTLSKANSSGHQFAASIRMFGRRCRSVKDDRQSDRCLKGKLRYR